MTGRFALRRRGPDSRLVAAAIGAITGVRSTAGITAVTHVAPAQGLLGRLLTRGTELMASSELIADKAVNLPARTEPAPLAARVLLGGTAAGFFARSRGDSILAAAAIAGATAAAVGVGATLLRRTITRNTNVPDAAVGLAEDAVVLAGSAWIVRAAGSRKS